jgi:DNA-binding response OmpR family regulator
MTERESNHQRFQKDNGKRILVLDDEYDISLTIKVVLEENGFKVDSSNDASQALEVLTMAECFV